jgi:hypothetical protein
MKQFRETATAAGVVLPKNLSYVRIASQACASQRPVGHKTVLALQKFTERKPRTA